MLSNRAAIPATIGAAKLLPVSHVVAAAGAAPKIRSPGASTPFDLYASPQLLVLSGLPLASSAPTASTVGIAAGTCRHSQPSFPAAETTSTLLFSHNSSAWVRTPSASLVGDRCPPLTLMT